MSDLLALADRVEKEAAGSRELDAEIDAALNGGRPSHQFSRDTAAGRLRNSYSPGTVFIHEDENHNGGNVLISHHRTSPKVAASIDAAISLVPEGMEWLVRSASHLAVDNKDQCYANVGNQSGEAHADTGSCALCAAALRALSNTGSAT